MSDFGRIYKAGETMPAQECRYCLGKGTLKNLTGSGWQAPRLIRVRCTHKVGDPYGFALDRKSDTKRAWLVCLGIASALLIFSLLFGGQG